MILRPWNELPENMRTEEVRPYYDILSKHKVSLILKRLFDFTVSLIMLLILWPLMILIAALIKIDSPGPALFFQERVTTYGKIFKIWKFRTMIAEAEKIGAQVTISNDNRITKIGKVLRKTRLDEVPQLINILCGDMSFVGTRPEVVKYVQHYTPEMMATLLLPAGVTSEASIRYKDEYKLLSKTDNIDRTYVEQVLPAKMVEKYKGRIINIHPSLIPSFCGKVQKNFKRKCWRCFCFLMRFAERTILHIIYVVVGLLEQFDIMDLFHGMMILTYSCLELIMRGLLAYGLKK